MLDYPETLESFTMHHVHMRDMHEQLNFRRIAAHMPDLHTIRIEHCPWMRVFCLHSFSRLQHLRHLSLRGCDQLQCQHLHSDSYSATRHGFRQLHTLDLRETPVGDSDIKGFSITSQLRRLYLQAPPSVEQTWLLAPVPPNYERYGRLADYEDIDLITDFGVCMFGNSSTTRRCCTSEPVDRSLDTQLECIVLRGYRCITDTALEHLAVCAPQLRRLDVRETAVTAAGVRAMRQCWPSCELLTSLRAEAAAEEATNWCDASSMVVAPKLEPIGAQDGGAAAADYAVAGGSGTNQSRALDANDFTPEVKPEVD